ncbi:hypothetical protein RB595_004975 [Gaeumannomyces hyphopodioides]
MRFTVKSALAMLATATVVVADGCNANNCARAVTGTRDKIPSLETRRADCSAFMLATVTPATVTTTTTISVIVSKSTTSTSTTTTTISTTTTTGILDRRQATVVPSIVPAYASACPNAAAYRSACSCWGITARTTTVDAPSSTASTTATETATVTVTEVATATATDVAKVCAAPAAPCDLSRPDKCCTLTCCRLGGQTQARCTDNQGNCFSTGPSKRWVLQRSEPVGGEGASWSRVRPDGTVEVHTAE